MKKHLTKCLLLLTLPLIFPALGHAQRTLLVDFGTNAATTTTPFSDWTQILRHPSRTQWMNPTGYPDHQGIALVDTIPSGEYGYFGIRGLTAYPFARGQRIVATFYNRSSASQTFRGRVSFTDSDSPDAADPSRPWYTLYNQDVQYGVPGQSLFEYEFFITDSTMVHHNSSPPSAGPHTLVNISIYDNNSNFILTRIELADDADITPPQTPSSVTAELISTSTGCPRNAIKLAWDHSIDPGQDARGVAKYLIYRNGELYEELPQAVIDKRGETPWLIDLSVRPQTTYSYRISAIDSAPFGMHASPSNPLTRKGNESALSAPVTIQTLAWQAPGLINPYTDLVYKGVFRLPDNEDWAYAHRGLAFYPKGNPQASTHGERPGSLYGIGHNHRCHISEISIPEPVITSDITTAPRARTLKPFTDIWPRVYDGSHTPPGAGGMTVGLAFHPARNGVADHLYYTLSMWYNPDADSPLMGVFDLSLTGALGAWHVGALPPDNIYPGLLTHLLFAADPTWADKHTGGRSLVAGSVVIAGSGTPSRGPVLYATAPWENGALPAHDQAVSSVNLLRYEGGTNYHRMLLNFTGGENGDGAAWIRAASRGTVAIQITRSVGESWYGDGGGQQNCSYDIPARSAIGSKGYNYTGTASRLIFYNPSDLAAVAAGSMAAHEPQPYTEYDLKPFAMKPSGMSATGALAYDEENRALYFIEHNGDPGYIYGYSMIHVWEVSSRHVLPFTPVLLLEQETE